MSAQSEVKTYVERILRLKDEQDEIGSLIKEIYAEAKGNGYDKTALGDVVTHVRKISKKGADVMAERNATFDLYLDAYEGRTHAGAHTREKIEEIDTETGEVTIIDQDDDDGNHLTVKVDPRIAAILAGSSNGRTPDFDSGNAGSKPAPVATFESKEYVLRPHCQKPNACGGYGSKHCHECELHARNSTPTPQSESEAA